jgi:hypothetical protein
MHTGTEDLLKLRELPDLAPPLGVWERVLAAQQARAAARRFRYRAAAAVAAVALTGTLAYVVATFDSTPRPTLFVAALPPLATAAQPRVAPVSYAPLVAESARLERLLAELPAPRPLMMGSTASTIVGLEDRIAVVDAQLSYAAARDLAAPYREALWSERVELMNALVHVRFAQIEAY